MVPALTWPCQKQSRNAFPVFCLWLPSLIQSDFCPQGIVVRRVVRGWGLSRVGPPWNKQPGASLTNVPVDLNSQLITMPFPCKCNFLYPLQWWAINAYTLCNMFSGWINESKQNFWYEGMKHQKQWNSKEQDKRISTSKDCTAPPTY